MQLNDDFSRRAVVHAARMGWTPSPASGVERRMLYRVGEEKARATSIVRYAANSHFPRHEHPGGEEILVLEGVFHDEHGAYPAGAYLRNPPGTGHAPGSEKGCVLFVKLWQFRKDDKERIVRRPDQGVRERDADGVESILLYDHPLEQVRIAAWPAQRDDASRQCAGPGVARSRRFVSSKGTRFLNACAGCACPLARIFRAAPAPKARDCG